MYKNSFKKNIVYISMLNQMKKKGQEWIKEKERLKLKNKRKWRFLLIA